MISEKVILAAKKCGDIFSNNKDVAKAEYRELSRKYHPDIYKNDNGIMAKINSLYEKAMYLIEIGEWEVSNQVILVEFSGKKSNHKFLSENNFELGVFYICDDEVIYILEAKHEKYYQNAIRKIQSLKYANDGMKKEISRFMPKIMYNYKLKDGRWCIAFYKTADMFLLDDLLNHFNGMIPPEHSAWIISRLNNICCYLDYIKVAHNGISLSNCFVSPEYHTIILLGGWWYCINQGEKMIGTQKAIYDIIPIKEKGMKIATIITDLESSKLIGRQILGNLSLTSSKKEAASYPKAIARFLRSGSSEKAVDEFRKWNDSLTEAFGKRKFIKLNINKNDIYKI